MNNEQKDIRKKYQNRFKIIVAIIMVMVFVVTYFVMGYFLESITDFHTISELNAIKSYAERNPDCERLIQTIKKDSPHFNIKIEIDNEEKTTALTILNSEDDSYNLCINYDEQMNMMSSKVQGGIGGSDKVSLQVLFAVIPVLAIAVVSLMVRKDYVYKKLKFEISQRENIDG